MIFTQIHAYVHILENKVVAFFLQQIALRAKYPCYAWICMLGTDISVLSMLTHAWQIIFAERADALHLLI